MIGILTACDDVFEPLADIQLPILDQFAKKHNYRFVHKNIIDFDYPASWYKIYAFLEEFNKNQYDYLLWLDTDTLILNSDFKLESLIVESKDIYISKDINGINCGVMMLKNSHIIKSLLYATLHLSKKYLNHVWWEQAAIMELMDTNFLNIQEHIQFIPQNIFNAYDSLYVKTHDNGYVDSNTFILHLPATNNTLRYHIMKEYRNKHYGF